MEDRKNTKAKGEIKRSLGNIQGNKDFGSWIKLHITSCCHGYIMTCASQSSLPGLVSAGIELIFSLVVGIVLCFEFNVRTMLITH